MDAPPFPTAPDQMSARWLESRTGFDLERIEVLQIGEGSGFAGSVYRIWISHRNHSSDLPESVIWKTTSGHRPTHFLLRRLGAYKAEAGFYSEMAGVVGMAPETYFASHDPTSGSICIIMEDLSGLRPGDQIAGCSEEESSAVVVELAAQVWVMKDRARIIEGMLERGERVTAEAIDHFEPSDEEQQSLRKERDDFISRLFREITTDLA